MKIWINGEERILPDGISTIDALLASIGVEPKGIAVELNLEIVPKARFRETAIKEGDRVELVRMVGGG